MTQKLFWQDPYLTQLEAQITQVDQDLITLDRTIFFAFSGGQESDSGTIGGYPVHEARKAGTAIHYRLGIEHGLKPHDSVMIRIDWQRRYRLMRLHFAAEIILELAYQNLASIQKIGAHIAEDKARIDFEWPDSIAAHFLMLEEKANAIVTANHHITSAFSDEINERRYWEISAFARVACGGTHLNRTGEVGSIRLKRKNIGKGKERVEIYVGERFGDRPATSP